MDDLGSTGCSDERLEAFSFSPRPSPRSDPGELSDRYDWLKIRALDVSRFCPAFLAGSGPGGRRVCPHLVLAGLALWLAARQPGRDC